jgi:hypothetical protein
LAAAASPAWAAFESGSTGADGAFAPVANTELELPPDGIFNFTTIDVPAGVTVTFRRNTANTPAILLASGNVTIGGTLDLSGKAAASAGAAGDGNIADDGVPGDPGIGGHRGGVGGRAGTPLNEGGAGIGPGGGGRGLGFFDGPGADVPHSCGAGGGGFGTAGSTVPTNSTPCLGNPNYGGRGGATYGTADAVPLIGGSGGGGGSGGQNFAGGGGGGGGGAILIASSGTLRVTGAIRANGGSGGLSLGQFSGGSGGSGSGGAIRLVATRIEGNGLLSAIGGGNIGSGENPGGAGGVGRIRLEAEISTFTPGTTPAYVFGPPAPAFVVGLPRLRIARIGAVDVATQPNGETDVTLPEGSAGPVEVSLATTDVPLSATVKVTVKPDHGTVSESTAGPLQGSETAGTTTATVTLGSGHTVLQASAAFTVSAAQAQALSIHTGGERVVSVELAGSLRGDSVTTLVTESGRRVVVPGA